MLVIIALLAGELPLYQRRRDSPDGTHQKAPGFSDAPQSY